jgi:hypothetical protein
MAPKLSEVAQRVQWLLTKVWNGSQTRMASDIGISQSVISHVVTGRQEPGRKLLAAVASNSLINSKWLITGEGDPLITQMSEPGRRALYVARSLFEGNPDNNGECLGSMLEVPIRFYRASRYWVEVSVGNPLISFGSLRIAAGDFVLFEPDSEGWPESLVGHPCIVRTGHGELKFDYVVDQNAYRVETSGSSSEYLAKAEDGRLFRAITFSNEEVDTTPESPIATEILVAIGIFRMGVFGKP